MLKHNTFYLARYLGDASALPPDKQDSAEPAWKNPHLCIARKAWRDENSAECTVRYVESLNEDGTVNRGSQYNYDRFFEIVKELTVEEAIEYHKNALAAWELRNKTIKSFIEAYDIGHGLEI